MPITTIITITTAIMAWIYRRGKKSGMSRSEKKSITTQIKDLNFKIDEHAADDTRVHKSMYRKMDKIDSKIDQLVGSNKVIEKLITQHLTSKKD